MGTYNVFKPTLTVGSVRLADEDNPIRTAIRHTESNMFSIMEVMGRDVYWDSLSRSLMLANGDSQTASHFTLCVYTIGFQ